MPGSQCCDVEVAKQLNDNSRLRRNYVLIGLAALVWSFIYRNLFLAADWLTVSVLKLERTGHLGSAVQFFLFEVPKVLMLLTLVVFGVGILRSFFTPDRTRAI